MITGIQVSVWMCTGVVESGFSNFWSNVNENYKIYISGNLEEGPKFGSEYFLCMVRASSVKVGAKI